MAPPQTTANLILYVIVFLVVIINLLNTGVIVSILTMVKGVHHSNIHTWLYANWGLIKFEAVLRVMFSWGLLLALLFRAAVDIVGDELPGVLLAKPSNSVRLAAWVFSASVSSVLTIVMFSSINVAHYTQMYSGAECHTPVASAQDLQTDGGVSKLYAATLAGHKLGAANLAPTYEQSRRQQEFEQTLSHQSKPTPRASLLKRRSPKAETGASPTVCEQA